MRTEQEKEILQAIEENDIQNYIDVNYWKLDRATLCDLLKEVLYLLPFTEYKALKENLIEYRDFNTEESEGK